MSSQAAAADPLGLPGFTFADLHRPARLRDLYDRFAEEVAGAEPELWAQWRQYPRHPRLAVTDLAWQPDCADGATRQPLRGAAVLRRAGGRGAACDHRRLRRPLSFQDRFRPSPGAAVAEGRRACGGDRGRPRVRGRPDGHVDARRPGRAGDAGRRDGDCAGGMPAAGSGGGRAAPARRPRRPRWPPTSTC